MLSCFFRTPCRWCILITGCWGVEAVCLQNASQEQRILFNRETGETYPIGLWHTSDYPAARLATQVVQILVEERTRIEFNQKHIKPHPKNSSKWSNLGRRDWGTERYWRVVDDWRKMHFMHWQVVQVLWMGLNVVAVRLPSPMCMST